jgi:hypothetical protein
MNFVFCYFDLPERYNLSGLEANRFLASSLVDSIYTHHPDAVVTQLSDLATPRVHPGVRELRLNVPIDQPNLARMYLYAAYNCRDELTIYIDADMILVRPFNLFPLRSRVDTVVVCERSFIRGEIEKLSVPQMASTYHDWNGKLIEDVMPYLACYAVTYSNLFWVDCLVAMHRLEPKFQAWFGDQVSMKEVCAAGHYDIRILPESICAYPVKYLSGNLRPENGCPFVHIKGNAKSSYAGVKKYIALLSNHPPQ